MGGATMGAIDPGNRCATIEMHTRYLASARTGRLTAEATVIRAGRRVVHLSARTTDADGRLVASATSSFAVLPPPDSV
ncbi:MAG: PaaI family thioesterase [Acidimicrobiales bacterium]|nr:PaaI family thioesterase [Acidimicrobiales bacterium]